WDVEALRGDADEELARLRRRMADCRGAVLHRLASGSEAFIWRPCRIGRDEIDLAGLDGELLGSNLQQRRLDSLSELHLASEHRNAAGIDAYPGVEHGRSAQTAREARRLWLSRPWWVLLGPRHPRKGETDDQCTATPQQTATRHGAETRTHCLASREEGSAVADFIAAAARRMAARMRICVPQRHRFGLMCWRISLSEGARLRLSSACARMIMPAMQKPHCAACSSMKARWRGAGLSMVPRPSSVVMRRPSAIFTGVMQERTAL